MSLTTSILDFLATDGGPNTSRQVADALQLDAKKVSDALGKLAKAGKVVKADGAFSRLAAEAAKDVPPAAPQPEEDLIGDVPAPAEVEDTEVLVPGDKTVDVAKWRRKISALLAKAERTDNAHEAETFTQAAERLMLRLGIHRAELEAVGAAKKEPIVQVSREFKGNYSLALVPFATYVAWGYGGLTVLQSRRSAMSRIVYVIGPKGAVEDFMRLLDSLVLQAFTALKAWQAQTVDQRRGLTDMQRAVMHRSFVRSFGIAVRERLAAARMKEEAQASTGAALVIASRNEEVSAYVAEKYGEVKAAKGGMKYASAFGADAGRLAGEKATLGGPEVAGAPKAVAAK